MQVLALSSRVFAPLSSRCAPEARSSTSFRLALVDFGCGKWEGRCGMVVTVSSSTEVLSRAASNASILRRRRTVTRQVFGWVPIGMSQTVSTRESESSSLPCCTLSPSCLEQQRPRLRQQYADGGDIRVLPARGSRSCPFCLGRTRKSSRSLLLDSDRVATRALFYATTGAVGRRNVR